MSCSVLRAEESHILWRITGGQPRITSPLGKMSLIPRRTQTKMPHKVHRGKAGKGNQTPSGANKNPRGPRDSQGTGNRTPSGSGGQQGG